MKPSNRFKIGNNWISNNHQAYIIAEIGSNHNNNLNLAKKLIRTAANCGADAVKFQTFKAKNHYSIYSPGFKYLDNKSTYNLIKSLEINRSWHPILKKYCKKHKIDFFSSPCDYEAVDQLKKINVVANKVASFDIVDLDLVKYIAKTGKPLILSTGMSTMEEINKAVQTCLKVKNNKIVILQCTSLYPAPMNISNINAIKEMKKKLNIITGYSDHTENDLSCLAAISVGAKIIEKHFTLNKKLKGPDHKFAFEPLEFKNLVTKIRNLEKILGDGKKNGPHKLEKEMFIKGRRSLHAATDIKKGQKLSHKMIKTKRPGYGISPLDKKKIIGKSAKKNIPEDHWISWDMIN